MRRATFSSRFLFALARRCCSLNSLRYLAKLVLGLAAKLIVGVIAQALVVVHLKNGFSFMAPGGGWEYPAFWILTMIAIALIGDGAPRSSSRTTIAAIREQTPKTSAGPGRVLTSRMTPSRA
jgi:hypothetical protein